MKLNDSSIMPFGQFKGYEMAAVPCQYLKWFYDTFSKQSVFTEPVKAVLDYASDDIDNIKQVVELDMLERVR